jgi:hypothetical protein
MRKKSLMLTGLSVLVLGTLLLACATVPTPTEKNFQAPVVTLNSVEVAHYWGWWYYSKKIEPTKGKAGDYGAPLDLAFVFDIENPNAYPVMMENLKFTVAFEEFDLNTVGSRAWALVLEQPLGSWQPGGKESRSSLFLST